MFYETMVEGWCKEGVDVGEVQLEALKDGWVRGPCLELVRWSL